MPIIVGFVPALAWEKEDLLRTLCTEGLQRYVAVTEAALGDNREPWEVFMGWVSSLVDADTHSLVQRLSGTFTPTEDMYRAVSKADRLNRKLFARIAATGVPSNPVRARTTLVM